MKDKHPTSHPPYKTSRNTSSRTGLAGSYIHTHHNSVTEGDGTGYNMLGDIRKRVQRLQVERSRSSPLYRGESRGSE